MSRRPWIRGALLDPTPIDPSTLFPPKDISMGSVVVHVENTRDTERGSHFRVTHPRRGAADVRLDFKTGRYGCTKCCALDCLHADAARKYVASQQPIDLGATGAGNERDG